jgi:hypothetical protein
MSLSSEIGSKSGTHRQVTKELCPAKVTQRLYPKKISLNEACSVNFDTLFSKLERIRVIMINYGGVGNISATYTAAKKIRELGYKGIIECVFNSAKYLSLLSTIHPEFVDPKAHQLEVVLHPQDTTQLNLPYCPLTLIGADDSGPNTYANLIQYNTGCFIQLNPYNWRPNRSVLSLVTQTQWHLPEENVCIFAQPVENSFSGDWASLFKLQDKGQLLIQSIYGLNNYQFKPDGFSTNFISPLLVLSRMIKALRALENDKNIVILLHNSIQEHYLTSLDDVVICDDLQKAINIHEQTLHQKKIILVSVGRVEQSLFRKIQDSCLLPPMGEGANAMTQLELSGKPFLHGGGALTFKNGPIPLAVELTSPVSKIQKVYLSACAILRKKTTKFILNDLTDFLRACIEKDKDLINYFLLRKQHMESNSVDLVALGLQAAQEAGIPLTIEDVKKPVPPHSIHQSQSLEELVIRTSILYDMQYPLYDDLQKTYCTNQPLNNFIMEMMKQTCTLTKINEKTLIPTLAQQLEILCKENKFVPITDNFNLLIAIAFVLSLPEAYRHIVLQISDKEGKTLVSYCLHNPEIIKKLILCIPDKMQIGKGRMIELQKNYTTTVLNYLARSDAYQSFRAILKLYPVQERLDLLRSIQVKGINFLSHIALNHLSDYPLDELIILLPKEHQANALQLMTLHDDQASLIL